jgi:hypothetical protein
MVARHLNTNVHYLKYNHLDKQFGQDVVHSAMSSGHSRFGDGKAGNNQNMFVVEKVKRCEFIPLEFMDDDIGLESSKIIEVGLRG